MNPQQTDLTTSSLGYRVLIEGTLTTKSFLHIGSEKPEEEVAAARQRRNDGTAQADDEVDDENRGIPLPVVTGSDHKAIIPASALRGALRSRLKRFGLAEDLMGRAAEPGGKESKVHGKARRVFVQDATIIEPCGQGLEFDDTQKCVDKIAMTAISRWRRAAQDKMLRSVEAVPPGVTFRVRIGICGDSAKEVEDRAVSRDEVAKVLAALGHCDWNQDNAGNPLFKPLQLGAFQKAGWGQVDWKTCKITTLTKQGLKQWLASRQKTDSGQQGWELCAEPVDEKSFVQPEPPETPDNVIHLPLTLAFESTFFTEDQREHTKNAIKEAHKQDPEKTPEKLAKVMRVGGRAWLSGQSLKGALRSQFERILRTKGIPCCDPTLDAASDFALTPKRCDPIHSADEVEDLCPACQVFGNGGWASTIEVSPFEEIDKRTVDTRREFLAISRFTGGGVPGLKFSADIAVRPKLQGHIQINLGRLRHKPAEDREHREGISPIWPKFGEAERLGALLHLFRDFSEGDIPVGAGRSKGFGTFKVETPTIESPQDKIGKAFTEVVVSVLTGRAISDELSDIIESWISAFDNSPSANPEAPAHGSTPTQESSDAWKAISNLLQSQAPTAQPSQSSFKFQKGSYNPYHWVPTIPAPAELLVPTKTIHQVNEHRHDIYAQEGLCGEIEVTIKPHTPIFVGGHRTRNASLNIPALVEHFKIKENGKDLDAIPSTSLRGLLSSTYEIATASAMRTLEVEEIYSYRMALGDESPDKPFNFIGKVKEHEGHLGVIPWARRPGAVRNDGITLAEKKIQELKNLTPPWVPTKYECLEHTDVLPNAYCLHMASRDFPPGRKNEIRFSGAPLSLDPRLGFAPGVLDRFHRIADDRTEATKEKSIDALQPYAPPDQKRGGEGKKYRVKDGDFLYFDTLDGRTVSRIALAQIWRDDVRQSLGNLFRDKNLLPLDLDWGTPGAARTDLTMVETAFGVVSQARGKKKLEQAEMKIPFPAYASKIIVTDAVLTNSVDGAVTPVDTKPEILRVLSAPKPPSPAYYFDPVSSSGIHRLATFQEIRDGKVRPRGRKMYLHLDWPDQVVRPWKSVDPPTGTKHCEKLGEQRKMQVQVQCLGVESRFTFKIRFDNLTHDEFLALCYTLRPTPHFRHKLGMAKPLGLGSVSFDVTAIRRIYRGGRYTSQGFRADRFTDVTALPAQASAWIDSCSVLWRNKSPKALKNSLDAFEIIGTTAVKTMQYPMTREQLRSGNPDREWELFKWPSENRKTAVKKCGGAMAHSMLPIASNLPDVEKGEKFPIPRTPSNCYVLIIKPNGVKDTAQFHEFTRDAIETLPLVSADAAAELIEMLPSDSVVYIISQGNAGAMAYHGRCVKRIELKSMLAPKDNKDDENRLNRLKEVLALGAS
jgi:CRISPR/Cas system CSM-associated protein Csm3 (group 7 of RAMP superfamily)